MAWSGGVWPGMVFETGSNPGQLGADRPNSDESDQNVAWFGQVGSGLAGRGTARRGRETSTY